MAEFVPFAKIARLSRECVITEKIDGTNAQIFIAPWLNCSVAGEKGPNGSLGVWSQKSQQFYELHAGSRTRWIQPENDNYGFARWAYEHAQELVDGLGEGNHFGEWWGSGIQRGYGLTKGEKRFSLFNVSRWGVGEGQDAPPACCSIVPVLYRGPFTTEAVETALESLRQSGSLAAPGFPNPEGIVIYHTAAKTLFKKTLIGDEKPKGSKE